MSHFRLRLAVVVGALFALVGPANAFAAGNLDISQVYGGGGNAGATYTHDFIELFNRGSVSAPLTGFSLQYGSATGNFGANTAQLTELSGSLAPGQYMLVQEAQGAGGTTPLPAPFISDPSPIAMSATAGKVALVNTTTPLNCGATATPCSPASLAQIVDLAGYGTTANVFEGSGPTPAPSNTSALARLLGGCQDTDDNAADFAVLSPPAPRNSTSPALACDAPTAPSGAGAATPASVPTGGTTLLTVTVAPGSNPASTGITVTGDLSAIGGSSTQSFFDDGTNGDAVGGNNVFSFGATVAAGTAPGAKSLPFGIADAEARNGSGAIALTVVAPPPAVEISEIQGAVHLSPFRGQRVATQGVVTAKRSNGFWIQDATPDGDDRTSEGIFVFTSTAPSSIVVGEAVNVTGTVAEFRPSDTTNLTTTELGTPTITSGGPGAPITPTVVGAGGRVPPTSIIDNDTNGSVETGPTTFDPAEDGIDFYESLEGMVLQVNDAVATGPTNSFGEISVVADNGANAGLRTIRGGVVIQPGDFNPERVILDDVLASTPDVHVGATFAGATIGVLDYGFGNFKLLVTTLPAVTPSPIVRETTVAAGAGQLSLATFNVENLDPGDPQSKFDRLAALIVNNLAAPDIVGLEEIQDDTGPTNDGVVSAGQTLAKLILAIQVAGGPTYDFRQINPVDGKDGGEPGGNIRVGFLFRTDRGLAFVDRSGGDSTTPVSVVSGPNGPELSASPGRVAPTDPAWNSSRKPLAAEFTFNGHKLFVIVNHFNSKGGDDPLFGRFQPPVLSSETQRNQQATVLAGFVSELLALDPAANVAVIGDLNDFQFAPPVQKLTDAGMYDLIETLPPNQRYSYVFDGNSQVLDHIMVSANLLDNGAAAAGYDVVHVNAEFFDQASDHDPQLVRLTMPTPTITASATPAANAAGWNRTAVTVGFACADPLSSIVGGCPASVVLGIEGVDQFVSRTVTTKGGLSLSDGVSNIDIDLTNPTVTYTGGKASYQVDELVSITCAAADALSGVASTTCANVSGPVYSFGLGPHTFTASAIDNAGNPGAGSVTFTVGVTYTSLCNLSRQFSSSQAIDAALCALLRTAEAADARGSAVGKRVALAAYVQLVSSQSGRALTAAEAATLILLSRAL